MGYLADWWALRRAQRRDRAEQRRLEMEWMEANRPRPYTVVIGYDPMSGPFSYVEGSAQDPNVKSENAADMAP